MRNNRVFFLIYLLILTLPFGVHSNSQLTKSRDEQFRASHDQLQNRMLSLPLQAHTPGKLIAIAQSSASEVAPRIQTELSQALPSRQVSVQSTLTPGERVRLGSKPLPQIVEQFMTIDLGLDLPETSLVAVVDLLNQDGEIAVVDLDYTDQICGQVSSSPVAGIADTKFGYQWYLNNTAQQPSSVVTQPDIGILQAWTLGGTASNIPVGIIDTGLETSHPDLQGVMTAGYNAFDDSTDVTDENGHGSHVAGTIAANHNDIGVRGINSKVPLYIAKAFDKDGYGTLERIIKAEIWLMSQGIWLQNDSWGGTDYAETEFQIFQAASDAGIVCINAAGNMGNDRNFYPRDFSLRLPHMINVGATDQNDRLAYWSSWNIYTVDCLAPGVDILSTYRGDYAYLSGTSMAAAITTGATAWYLSYSHAANSLSAFDLVKNGDILPGMADRTISGRRINLGKAAIVNNLQPFILKNKDLMPKIQAPTIILSAFSQRSIIITWKGIGDPDMAAYDKRYSRIDHYEIRCTDQEPKDWTDFLTDYMDLVSFEDPPLPSGGVELLQFEYTIAPGVRSPTLTRWLEPNKTYWIAMVAVGASGRESLMSNILRVTTLPAAGYER